MSRRAIYFFVLMIFLMNFSFAQENANDVLKRIQDKFNSVTDLSAEISQSVNGKLNLKGKVYFKKENNLRLEFKNILLVSDGETSWSYNEKDNKVVITSYESEGNKILSLQQLIYEYPAECDLSLVEAEGKIVLQLIPESNTFSFNSIKLFIDKDNLITRAIVDDPATGKIQIDLSSYQLNKNLPESLFSFTPPEGSQVLDLR